MRASLRQVDCIVEIHDARISFLLQREWLFWMIKPCIFKTFFNWSTYPFLEEIPHFKRVLMSGHTYLYWTRWIWQTRQKSRSYNLLHFIIGLNYLSKCKNWEYLNDVLIKTDLTGFFFHFHQSILKQLDREGVRNVLFTDCLRQRDENVKKVSSVRRYIRYF